MSLFKKKQTAVGKGTDRTVTLHKSFDVLNCTPVDYGYTQDFAAFKANAESMFKDIIEHTAVDDLCDDMLDQLIDAKIMQMKTSAQSQYTYHTDVIYHHKGLLEGAVSETESEITQLEQDLNAIDAEINRYQSMRDEHYL